MVTTRASIGAPVADRPDDPAEAPEGITRVTMLARISGTRNGAEWPLIGGDITLPAGEAADLIRNHLAKPAPEPVERAVVVEPTERATDDEPSERAVVEEPAERATSPERKALDPARRVAAKGK